MSMFWSENTEDSDKSAVIDKKAVDKVNDSEDDEIDDEVVDDSYDEPDDSYDLDDDLEDESYDEIEDDLEDESGDELDENLDDGIDDGIDDSLDDNLDEKDSEDSKQDVDDNVDRDEEKLARCPVDGKGGHYEDPDKRGNCDFYLDRDYVPGDRHGTNPDHETWGEICDQYGVEKIPFKDGHPDFSEISKGDVEIDEFKDDRDWNFTLADEKLAEQKKCSPEEVEQWRHDNKYTWHECPDCKTMQKVPTKVHGNISHEGGYSAAKNA